MFPGCSHRRHDIGGRGAAGDSRRPTVDHEVPDASRLLVLLVAGTFHGDGGRLRVEAEAAQDLLVEFAEPFRVEEVEVA